MGTKTLNIVGETVEFAIRDGLKQIGLPQEKTLIKILQRESHTLFGYREAIISIVFDEEESTNAIQEKLERDFRARFDFRYHDGMAQISVPHNFYDGKHLHTVEDRQSYIGAYLVEMGVSDPAPEQIQTLVEDVKCQSKWFTVKDLEIFPLNNTGASIHIRFSEDMMLCEGIIFHNGNIQPDDVYKVLKNQHVTHGIQKNNIKKVLDAKYTGFFPLAKGKPAVDDAPGDLEKFFQEDERKEFAKMMELLTIDTRSVKDINIAERNQLLLTIGDIIAGEDGYRINGDPILKLDITQASSALKVGPNVYFSDSGRELYANTSGHIRWDPKDNSIDVEPIYIVDGNVDFSEGNIIGFVGKVLIKGDVMPKFTISAEGNIEIHGSVEEAYVHSTNGSVFIGGAVVHRTEGQIEAAETVQCNIATNAKIIANEIIVDKEAMNSELIAKESIIATGQPGVILGGSISSQKFIQANTIGSSSGVQTEVRVGDTTPLRQELRDIRNEVSKMSAQLKESVEIKKTLELKKKARPLSTSQEKQLTKSKKEIPELEDHLNAHKERELVLSEEIKSLKMAKMEVLQTLHKQVDVHIYDAYMLTESEEKYTGLKCIRGEMRRYSIS